jgi:hypothetical protein
VNQHILLKYYFHPLASGYEIRSSIGIPYGLWVYIVSVPLENAKRTDGEITLSENFSYSTLAIASPDDKKETHYAFLY